MGISITFITTLFFYTTQVTKPSYISFSGFKRSRTKTPTNHSQNERTDEHSIICKENPRPPQVKKPQLRRHQLPKKKQHPKKNLKQTKTLRKKQGIRKEVVTRKNPLLRKSPQLRKRLLQRSLVLKVKTLKQLILPLHQYLVSYALELEVSSLLEKRKLVKTTMMMQKIMIRLGEGKVMAKKSAKSWTRIKRVAAIKQMTAMNL